MTILGKIILFFNILAAGAVVYTATQLWTFKQTESATALKYYLWLQGLPQESPEIPAGLLDEEPCPLGTEQSPYRMGVAHSVYSIRYGLLKDHFKGADKGTFNTAEPVNSRAAELKRVQTAVNLYVENLKSDDAVLAWLVGIYKDLRFEPGLLVLLADNFDEREAYRSLIRRPSDADALTKDKTKSNAETAKLALKYKFDAAMGNPNPAVYSDATARLKEKSKLALDTDEAVKIADEKLKTATKAYRDLAEPLLKNGDNYKSDAFKDQFAELQKLRIARDKAYEEFLAKYENRREADKELLRAIAEVPSTASDDADRLRRGIQILMLLDKGDSWQRRIVIVFGLKDYLVALKDRVERYKAYPGRYRQAMEAETAEFVAFYERAKEVAIDRDRLLYRQQEITAALKSQMDSSERDLKQTVTLNTAALAQMAAIEADIANRIAEQSKVEENLFDIEKQIGELLRLNYELEDKLDQTEKKVVGGK